MSIWVPGQMGPSIWGVIHSASIIDFKHIDGQRFRVERAIRVLKAIPDVHQCKKCDDHYREHIIPFLDDVERWTEPLALFRFMVDYHNEINDKLNKPRMSYDEALQRWGKQVEPQTPLSNIQSALSSHQITTEMNAIVPSQ